jgi:hypothetical protein
VLLGYFAEVASPAAEKDIIRNLSERSAGRWRMPSEPVALESRRSKRVRLKILIEVQGVSEPLMCEGETIVVNLHGALILTAVALRIGMKVSIHVQMTARQAAAEVVYVDPDQPRHCGIKLAKPENIWGISNDWPEGNSGRMPD